MELDPQFAEAWAALADAWVLIPEYNRDGSLDAIAAARDAVNRALELKPDLAQALTSRAYLRFMYDYDWVNAEKDFKRAMQLDPSYPTAKQWYGEFLAARDRDIDGALALFREAAALDPLAPIMWHVSGWVTSEAGRFEESLPYFDKALELNPQQPTHWATSSSPILEWGSLSRPRPRWIASKAWVAFCSTCRNCCSRQCGTPASASPTWRN